MQCHLAKVDHGSRVWRRPGAAAGKASVSAGGDRKIQSGDGGQVAAHLLVLPRAEQLRYLLFDLAHRRLAGCGRRAAFPGEVDALGPAVGGVLVPFQVSLRDEVVDELAHRLGCHAGAGGDVGEAKAVLDGEHLHRVAVGGTQVAGAGLRDAAVNGGGQDVVRRSQQGGRRRIWTGHGLTPHEGILIIRVPS